MVTAVDLVSRLVAVEGRVVDTCEPLSVVRGVTAVPWSLAALWLLVVPRVTVPLPLRLPVERVVAPLLLLLVVTVVGRLVEGLLTCVLVVLVVRPDVLGATLLVLELLRVTWGVAVEWLVVLFSLGRETWELAVLLRET